MNVRSRYTRLGVHRQQVHVEAAREAGEDAGEHERAEPLPVHGHADGGRGSGVLARRAQQAPEAAALVREGDADHEQRADRRLPEPGRLGHRRERVQAGADLLVVADARCA